MKSIAKKLSLAIAAIDKVECDARNNFNKYDYMSAMAVARAVRSEWANLGLAWVPDVVEFSHWDTQTRKGELYHAASVRVKFTIIDSESGEKVEGHGVGIGLDDGDKAIQKAFTAACKFYLRWLALIPDKSDPEADSKYEKALREANKDANEAAADVALLSKGEENRGHGKEGAAPVKQPDPKPETKPETKPKTTPVKKETGDLHEGPYEVEGKVVSIEWKERNQGGQKQQFGVVKLEGDFTLFVFDKKLFPVLARAKDQQCGFQFKENAGKQAGTKFNHMETVLWVGPQEYERDPGTKELIPVVREEKF